jgi:hypothetical protein
MATAKCTKSATKNPISNSDESDTDEPFRYGDEISPETPEMKATYARRGDDQSWPADNQERIGEQVDAAVDMATELREWRGVSDDRTIYLFTWDKRGQFQGCTVEIGHDDPCSAAARAYILDNVADPLCARDAVIVRRTYTREPEITEEDVSLFALTDARAAILRDHGTNPHEVYLLDVLVVGHCGAYVSVRQFLSKLSKGHAA